MLFFYLLLHRSCLLAQISFAPHPTKLLAAVSPLTDYKENGLGVPHYSCTSECSTSPFHLYNRLTLLLSSQTNCSLPSQSTTENGPCIAYTVQKSVLFWGIFNSLSFQLHWIWLTSNPITKCLLQLPHHFHTRENRTNQRCHPPPKKGLFLYTNPWSSLQCF